MEKPEIKMAEITYFRSLNDYYLLNAHFYYQKFEYSLFKLYI